jgi:copper chaperone NosL
MDRHKFAHSAMLIEYEDGTTTATCSLHCTAVELAINIDKTPRKLMVGDYGTKKLTDAETACWTLGGDLPGVMTKRAKWAFENRAECEKFAREHGATIVSLDDAIKASYEDMYSDTKMIREKRKMKRMQQQQQQQPDGKK